MAIITIGLSCYDQFFFIPNYPQENRKSFATGFLESGGGPCGNASYLLGRWGQAVYHITTLKDDSYGHCILNELNQVGVNTDYAIVNQQQITPLSAIMISGNNGNRTIFTHKKQSEKIFSKTELGPIDAFITQLNTESSTHVFLIDGHEYELSEYMLPKIKNKIVIMDAGNLRPSNLALAKYTHYVVASENFAQDLIQQPSLHNDQNKRSALEKIQEISALENTPIITLGEKGVISLEQGKLKHYPSYQCTPIDTTGAGDIFHGAFTYGIAQQWQLEKIIAISSLTAALSIEQKGVRNAIPDLAQVEAEYLQRPFNS